MQKLNYHQLRAYGEGTLDGYSIGTESNPYNPETSPEEHKAYSLGYDFGVAMYCQEISKEGKPCNT